MYFVYILECADKSFYVGSTSNLERRTEQHNDSKWGAHYTKIRRPVVLVYSEKFATLKEARRRESEIKGWRREKKIDLISKTNKDAKTQNLRSIKKVGSRARSNEYFAQKWT